MIPLELLVVQYIPNCLKDIPPSGIISLKTKRNVSLNFSKMFSQDSGMFPYNKQELIVNEEIFKKALENNVEILEILVSNNLCLWTAYRILNQLCHIYYVRYNKNLTTNCRLPDYLTSDLILSLNKITDYDKNEYRFVKRLNYLLGTLSFELKLISSKYGYTSKQYEITCDVFSYELLNISEQIWNAISEEFDKKEKGLKFNANILLFDQVLFCETYRYIAHICSDIEIRKHCINMVASQEMGYHESRAGVHKDYLLRKQQAYSQGLIAPWAGPNINDAITNTEHCINLAILEKAASDPVKHPVLVGDKPRPPEKSGCFIATSVYGSFDHPHVMMFRRFRDKSLTPLALGRAFISFYYVVGPYLASLVSKSPILKSATKRLLDSFANKLNRNQ